MASQFMLEIITPEHTFFTGMVDMVVVEALDGKMGILKGHLPIVVVLKTGEVDVTINGKKRIASSAGGFMEVMSTKTTLFLESIEWADQVDVERCMEAKDRAERFLHNPALSQKEQQIYKKALERANARLRISKMSSDSEKEK